MTLTPEQLVAAGRDLRAALARLLDLQQRAETEGRSLSRRELAEVRELREKADRIHAQLPSTKANVGARSQIPLYGTQHEENDNRDVLGSEDSVRSWAEQRGLGGGGIDEGSPALGRALRGMITGSWKGAEAERRALGEASDSTGGALLAPQLAGEVIDRLRPATRVIQSGARILPMTTSQLYVGRMTGGVTPSWKIENDAISTGQPVYSRVILEARTLPVLIRVSRELADDMSDAAAAQLESEVYKALAIAVDDAALQGDGSGATPTGLLHADDVPITQLGSGNGDTVQWTDLLTAAGDVRAANAEPTAFIASSRTWTDLSSRVDSTGRWLGPPPAIAELPQLSTNIVPNDGHVGTSTDCSTIFCGDFRNLWLAFRIDAMRAGITRLEERFADNLQIGILAYLRMDVGVMIPESFAVLTGVRPDVT